MFFNLSLGAGGQEYESERWKMRFCLFLRIKIIISRLIQRPTVDRVCHVVAEGIVQDIGSSRARCRPILVACFLRQVPCRQKQNSAVVRSSWLVRTRPETWRTQGFQELDHWSDVHDGNSANVTTSAISEDPVRRGLPSSLNNVRLRQRIRPNQQRDNPSPISYCRNLRVLQQRRKSSN